MSTREVQAIKSLAEIEDNYHDFSFEPYSSNTFSQKPKATRPHQKRPQTVTAKRNLANSSFGNENKREELKRQLRVLEDTNYEQTTKVQQKIITSSSLFCMAPLVSKYNGFPAQPVRKQQTDKFMSPKSVSTK